MALEITKSAIEGTVGIVHIESDDMQELLSPAARHKAYDERVKLGLSGAGLEATEVTPLDKDGKIIDEPQGDNPPVRWRRSFQLTPSPI